MIFGIDVIYLLVNAIPVLPHTLILGVPPILADTGTWAGCISEYGLTAIQCQGL